VALAVTLGCSPSPDDVARRTLLLDHAAQIADAIGSVRIRAAHDAAVAAAP